MSAQPLDQPKTLGIAFTATDFHSLCYHARRYQMPVRDFIEWAMRCFVTSHRDDEQRATTK